MRTGLTLIAALLALGWVSCNREDSSSVDQDKIFTEYELFYNANEDITYARATFRFSSLTGTKLELSTPSEVSFEGDVLSFKNALAYYEREYAGKIDSGAFMWINTLGDTFNNSVHIIPIDFPAVFDTIDRFSAYELFWQGDSLGSNETVTLFINGPNEGDGQTFIQDNINSKSMILATNKLQLLPMAPATCYMDRRYSPALTEQTSRGGLIIGRYRPVNQMVYLK